MRTYEVIDANGKATEIKAQNLKALDEILVERGIVAKEVIFLTKAEKARRRSAFACDPRSETYWSS